MGTKLIIIVVVLIVAMGGLAIYGSQVTPPSHTYEQVLPNDRFPS